MKYIGVDLAGNPRNNTGFCILEETEEEEKTLTTCLLHSDEEIVDKILKTKPKITAIDAPLTYAGTNRRCDMELQEYGALPPTLPGMEVLAKRGTRLATILCEKNQRYIEVYATATAKILGLYDRNEREMQKKLIEANLKGDVNRRILSKDEIDAVFCALTAYLHDKKKTINVGDEAGYIIVPEI